MSSAQRLASFQPWSSKLTNHSLHGKDSSELHTIASEERVFQGHSTTKELFKKCSRSKGFDYI
jgi:hypothetical protein